jgi:DNA-binding transcriptional LysR family regulator
LFRQLEYLVALSRERHFARAAQACFVSQPALSESIRKLEEELDVPLVRRGRKFEGLTPEGQRIVVWAQRILADRDALAGEVAAMRTGLSGQLRVGSIPTASAVVSLLAEPFCAEHPLVTVQVATDLRSVDVLQRLQDFEIDAGITYIDEDLFENFQVVPLYHERYVLLTGTEALADRPVATWAEASALPLCLLTTAMQGRRVLNAAFAEAGVQPTPRVETDSVGSMFAYVKTGGLAGVVPHAWLHVFGTPLGMRALPLIEPTRAVPIGLVITAREPGSVMARALVDIARRVDMTAVLDGLTLESEK